MTSPELKKNECVHQPRNVEFICQADLDTSEEALVGVSTAGQGTKTVRIRRFANRLEDAIFRDKESGHLFHVNPSRPRYDWLSEAKENLRIRSKAYIWKTEKCPRVRLYTLGRNVKRGCLTAMSLILHYPRKATGFLLNLAVWKKLTALMKHLYGV